MKWATFGKYLAQAGGVGYLVVVGLTAFFFALAATFAAWTGYWETFWPTGEMFILWKVAGLLGWFIMMVFLGVAAFVLTFFGFSLVVALAILVGPENAEIVWMNNRDTIKVIFGDHFARETRDWLSYGVDAAPYVIVVVILFGGFIWLSEASNRKGVESDKASDKS